MYTPIPGLKARDIIECRKLEIGCENAHKIGKRYKVFKKIDSKNYIIDSEKGKINWTIGKEYFKLIKTCAYPKWW